MGDVVVFGARAVCGIGARERRCVMYTHRGTIAAMGGVAGVISVSERGAGSSGYVDTTRVDSTCRHQCIQLQKSQSHKKKTEIPRVTANTHGARAAARSRVAALGGYGRTRYMARVRYM